MKQRFALTGMTCAACAANIEKKIAKLDGVQLAQVSLLTNSMSVEFDGRHLQPRAIEEAVRAIGYGATAVPARTANTPPGQLPDNAKKELQSDRQRESQVKRQRLRISIGFLIPLFYLSMEPLFGWPLPGFLAGSAGLFAMALTQFLLLLPILAANNRYFFGGTRALFHGVPNMDSLVAVGTAAATIYGVAELYRIAFAAGQEQMISDIHSVHLYFESAGMILTLVTLGKYFEARALAKTGDALAGLRDLAPKEATVERNGQEETIPAETIRVGDLLLIRPGASIPADGVVVSGRSWVDESALTGENYPVSKQEGDRVHCSTMNQSGALRVRVEHTGAETLLAQIINMTEKAAISKAPIARIADRISGFFVPAVLAVAAVTLVVWLFKSEGAAFALSRAISVLVISCPCALGLATPLAVMSAAGKGASMGILFKSAESLENLRRTDTMIMDKTGTLTVGKPHVTDICPLGGISEEALLQVAGSLELHSEHPLAEAVLRHVQETGMDVVSPDSFKNIPGRGIWGLYQGEESYAGNRALMDSAGIDITAGDAAAHQYYGQGKTVLYVASAGVLMGLIAASDTIRPTAAGAIRALKSLGVDSVMLTGDSYGAANTVASALEIDLVKADLLPGDKQAHITQLRKEGKTTVMLGDGINDAPSLKAADLGMAVASGTDIAIDSADIILMNSDPMDAPDAIRLSRAAMGIIRQNLFWALIYNALCIPIAAGVFYGIWGLALNPMIAAAAMSLSSVFVVSNSLRLQLFRPLERTGNSTNPEQFSAAIQLPEKPAAVEKPPRMKTVRIEGMSCGHCSASVEKALGTVHGVKVRVSLEEKTAVVELEFLVEDDVLIRAVKEAGYTVTSIE